MNPESAAPFLPGLVESQALIAKWATSDSLFAQRLATGMPAEKATALLGMSFDRQGKAESAVKAFATAVALSPENAGYWTNYGIALDRLGQSLQAVFCLERSVTLSPQSTDAWVLLGIIRRKLGDLAGAEAACRKAVELDPNLAFAWECLGLIKEAQVDYPSAIDCLNRRAKLAEVNAPLMLLLGKLNLLLARIDPACEALAKAVELEPASLDHRQMLRKAQFMQTLLAGNLEQAIERLQTDCQKYGACADTDLPTILKSAFSLFSAFGPQDAALRAGKKLLELQPDNKELEYLLKAVSGDTALDRSPEKFVTDHFNDFASKFDSQLVGVLGYDIPKKLAAAIRSAAPDRVFDSVLDAGCGTGLCGPLLRPVAQALHGIDLSDKMIEEAAKKGAYDHLEQAEIASFLERNPRRFNLVVAADVLIYIGDLRHFFEAASQAMLPSGMLAVSTERTTGATYQLRSSGRFAHSPEYVKRCAASAGFTELTHQETTIRLEGASRTPGDIYLWELI